VPPAEAAHAAGAGALRSALAHSEQLGGNAHRFAEQVGIDAIRLAEGVQSGDLLLELLVGEGDLILLRLAGVGLGLLAAELAEQVAVAGGVVGGRLAVRCALTRAS
jgi:hypothetical protein